MPINVGDLLKERDRLNGVIEEAKIARSRIKQINVLIAMYGDQENVTVKPARAIAGKDSVRPQDRYRVMTCPKAKCKGKVFKGQAGLSLHNQRVHGGIKGNPRLRAVG